MSAFLSEIGIAVPTMTVTRGESLRIAELLCGPYLTDADWLPAIYEHSGVQTRHQALGRPLVDDLLQGTRLSGSPYLPGPPGGPTTAERMAVYAREAPPLTVAAARDALVRNGIAATAVTHVVTVSCTGFLAPGLDLHLIRDLRLPATVQRTHVGFMGCHGAINGLRVATALANADSAAVVLMVATELCSLHYYYGADPGKVIANALFADGAAAAIVSARGPGRPILASGSALLPKTEGEMTWTIGDNGFAMTMTKQIPKAISLHLKPWLEPWLRSQGQSLQAISEWAIHPGGPKILEAAQEALELPDEAIAPSRQVLRDYGNMSSPTVLFILRELAQPHQSPGPAVLLGFGPGLVVEGLLLGSRESPYPECTECYSPA